MIDHTSIVSMNELVHEYNYNGGKVEIHGFENHHQVSKNPTSMLILKLS